MIKYMNLKGNVESQMNPQQNLSLTSCNGSDSFESNYFCSHLQIRIQVVRTIIHTGKISITKILGKCYITIRESNKSTDAFNHK
mmetsp:Transcript_21135/g.45854  ORF Transcript_21135/g.45854 Transcript_21135/m.45854 type:complete len:84 (-) Transcript_21135:2288-2539(-)